MGSFKRVVLCDDNLQFRQLVREFLNLSDENLVFVSCASGQELLNRMKELQPDLILLDLLMPEMNGPDILEAMQKTDISKNVPVIIITGFDAIDMLEAYKKANIIGILKKPLDMRNLHNTIKKMWREHVGQDNLIPA